MKYDVFMAKPDKEAKKLVPIGPFDKEGRPMAVLNNVIGIKEALKADPNIFNEDWDQILTDKDGNLVIDAKLIPYDSFIKKGYVPAIKLIEDPDYIPKGKESVIPLRTYIDLLRANMQGSDITKEIFDANGDHFMDAKAKDLIGHIWADQSGEEFVCHMLNNWITPEFEYLSDQKDERSYDYIVYYVFVKKGE